MNDNRQIAKLVKSFSGVFPPESKLCEEFVCHFGALVFVNPYSKGDTGGVVVSSFADGAECPVDLKGLHPSMRDLSNLRTSRRGRSYCR